MSVTQRGRTGDSVDPGRAGSALGEQVSIASPDRFRQVHDGSNDDLAITSAVPLPAQDAGREAAAQLMPARPPDAYWRNVLRQYRTRALIGDFLCGSAGAVIAFVARFGNDLLPRYVIFSALVPLAWVLTTAVQRGYEFRFLGTGPEEYRRLIDAGLMLFITIAVTSYALRGDVARGYVVIAVPFALVLTLYERRQLRLWLARLRARGIGLRRVLVVGRWDTVSSVIDRLRDEPMHGLVPVGACVEPAEVQPERLRDVPVLGRAGQVLEAVQRVDAHVVAVVSHPDLSGTALRRLSWDLEDRGVELVVSPGIVEVARPRLTIWPVAGMSLLHLERPSTSAGPAHLKNAFDRTVAAFALLMLSPVLLAIAMLVRVTSPGPVIFRQTRIGAHGREFTMLKFRSMVADAEDRQGEVQHLDEGNGLLFKIKDDPRVTRVGAVLRRFSLDELPQLVNVVRGEMSLVGPRPPLPHEVAAYGVEAIRRLRVRPGLTGLWQVSGRSDLSQEESLRLDLRYVDNWSLLFDVTILWRTLRAVVRGSGAY